MPKFPLPLFKMSPWMRVVWVAQIVMAGIHELEAHERKEARELAAKLARERRLNAKERQRLTRLARKAGMGAARGARPGKRKGR
jgi:hypothetical protein